MQHYAFLICTKPAGGDPYCRLSSHMYILFVEIVQNQNYYNEMWLTSCFFLYKKC